MEKEVIVVWSSDLHIGLKTDEIDRTEEIIDIALDVVEKANLYKENGHDTFLVFGGDVFNDNNPSEKVIASIFPVLNLIKKYDIKTYFIVGNHESVYDPNRLSCLSFIKKAKAGYPMISVVDDIASIEIGTFDSGKLQFTFLPHITPATIEMRQRKGKSLEVKSVKDYITKQCNGIVKKLGNGVNHYVFSHLNVSGAHPGSEENLLKKSEAYLPPVLTNTPYEYSKPVIIQGHIHSNQIIGNINVIGSPIYCSFGESGNKYYSVIKIPKTMSEKGKIELVESKHRPFLQLELNLMNETKDFFEIEEVKEFYKKVEKVKEMQPIVKFDITINSENNNYSWESYRQRIMSQIDGCYVKPILPKVIAKKHIRSIQQKLGLNPVDAVQVYLKKNLKREPEKAKRIYKITKKYLGV